MTKVYKFCQFTLTSHSNLVCDGEIINLPPKEFFVLRFLVENAGNIIDKETIIKSVWDGGCVSDESLTRCIYVIRRVLGQSRENRFIETVYGRGYRFVPHVEVVELETENELNNNKTCRIAAFPFDMTNSIQATMLHEYILNDLHQLANISNNAIHVIPSILTRYCKEYAGMTMVLEDNNVDYYISGVEIKHSHDTIISIELVRARDHFVVMRETITITGNVNVDIIAQRNVVINFCKHINVNLMNCQTALPDGSSALLAS